jgi:redox-sensitive bicupin YhaK (pirin superfamily)
LPLFCPHKTEFQAGEFIEFDKVAGEIEIKNTSPTAIDLLLFGGEEYKEPVVAEGPFVMNSQAEIATAYRDFYAGKYGVINVTTQTG